MRSGGIGRSNGGRGTGVDNGAPADVGLTIGDGTNLLGSDPEHGALADIWLTIDGPGTNKSEGNRYDTAVCTSERTFGCSVEGTGEVPNTEHRSDGTFVSISADSVHGNDAELEIQVFDPAFVNVGNECQVAMPDPVELTELSEWYDDVDRYAAGPGEWCTGDMRAGPAGAMTTTFIVREPDATPEDHTDNPIADVCSPRSFPPHDPERGPTVAQLLHPSDGAADPEALIDPDDDRDSVAEVFRRWVTVCTIPAEAVLAGVYLLQIRANAGTDPLRADPSGRSGGRNRMSVRAVRTEGGTASGAGIVVGGHDVALTANDRGHSPGVVALPIRSVPVTPGGTLELSLFDLSDLSDGRDGRSATVELAVLDLDGDPLVGCEATVDDGRALATDPSRCSIQYRRGELNERLLTIRGPAPPDCGTATRGPCSLRVVLTSLTPAGIHDTISFGAAIRNAQRLDLGTAPVDPERPDAPLPERTVTPPPQ